MDSLSMLTGFAWGADPAPGRLTLGAFFEYGNGSYDTYNSFGNAASVHGGVLARMDFAPAGPGHVYAEASGRVGKTHNDYGSSDLRDAAGRKADYDSASPYYGLHGGVGYVWSIDETTSLDLYGKYFWTRQEGDGVKLSTGESLRFDDVDSSRVRFGESRKAELFMKKRSRDLTFGVIGFRASSAVKPMKRTTWEQVLGFVRDAGMIECIRTKQEVDKEALRQLPPEKLAAVGCRLEQTDGFFYELNETELAGAESA